MAAMTRTWAETSAGLPQPFSIDSLFRISGTWRACSNNSSTTLPSLSPPSSQMPSNQRYRSRPMNRATRAGSLVSTSQKNRRRRRETVTESDQRIVSAWLEQSHKTGDRLQASCCAALHRVATAIISRHGRLLGDQALPGELALTLLCNDFGSEAIGEAILPFVQEAVAREGYRFL